MAVQLPFNSRSVAAWRFKKGATQMPTAHLPSPSPPAKDRPPGPHRAAPPPPQAGWFARMVATFCERLGDGFHHLHVLADGLVNRVFRGVRQEVSGWLGWLGEGGLGAARRAACAQCSQPPCIETPNAAPPTTRPSRCSP